MLVPMDPIFFDEETCNRGRGEDGWLTSGRGAKVPVRTRYLHGAARWQHEVAPDQLGRLFRCVDLRPIDTAGRYPGLLGWDQARPIHRMLYAMDESAQLYVADPNSVCTDGEAWRRRAPGGPLPSQVQIFHHSSFVAGASVICVGDLGTDAKGRLRVISNWSGHYRPSAEALRTFLQILHEGGVDLSVCVAEAVVEGAKVRAFDALAFLEGCDVDVTERWFRDEAIRVAETWMGRAFDAAALEELDERVSSLRRDGPEVFDPSRRAHWNWLARWVLEDQRLAA